MATVRINDVGVTKGDFVFALNGTWAAQVTLQTSDPDEVSGSVDLTIGEETFKGTATASTADGGEVTATVIGGANGLNAECAPQHYVTPCTVRTVVSDALGIGGETLSSSADSVILDTALPMFTRVRERVADTLNAVLGELGASWRVGTDGSVWVGTETWDALDEDELVITGENPNGAYFVVAPETASVRPGLTLRDKQITQVVYELSPSSLRAIAFYGEAGSGGQQQEVEKLIAKRTAKFDFFASYQMKVVGQNNDGTLELQSADARVPNMSKVPLLGIPGMKENKLLPNTPVMLAFRNGHRSKPFVYSADMGQSLALTLSAAGTLKLEGTAVECGGNEQLVKFIPTQAWVGQLTTACAVAGISVPPLVNAQTTITKGT